jgi:hypothetical protein
VAAAPPPPPAAAPARQATEAIAERRSADESDLPLAQRQQGAAAARSTAAGTVGIASAAKARAAEPLAAIDAALAEGARWQAAGVTVQHGPAQRAFWSSVQEATRGRWEPAPPSPPPAPWLALEPGSPRTMLWIMDGALHVTADGRSWRAPVDAALLADWQAQVARW